MTKDDVQKLDLGAYRITWKGEATEKTSIAVVGIAYDGSRWLSCANWTYNSEIEIHSACSTILWEAVESVERIDKQETTMKDIDTPDHVKSLLETSWSDERKEKDAMLSNIGRRMMKEMGEEEGFNFVPTSGNSGERHLNGLVGKLWRIKNPETVRVGNCFLRGRLKAGDLFLCIKHSGDCFQDYIYVKEYTNAYKPCPEWEFGAYGIGDSEEVEISHDCETQLRFGNTFFT